MSYSYCNSIVQALYYSVPFREHVVRYPPHSPADTPNGQPKIVTKIRQIHNGPLSPNNIPKGMSAAEAMRRRQAINSGQPVTNAPGQRAEDKPDSPEYKKKQAMLVGPVLELDEGGASTYGMKQSTFTALKDIFMAMIAQDSRTGVLSPTYFLEQFKQENEFFRNSQHQDAHEFYGIILNSVITNVETDALEQQKQLVQAKNNISMDQSMRLAVASAATSMGLGNGTRSPGTGWVHDIFEGILTSETKCLTCEMASQRDETFLDLSIDLEENSSVTSCLRKFSAEEMLCERNKFHCDNCGGLQEAEKRMKIKKLPKILALHLKRFRYSDDQGRLDKVFHRVVYPYHLRMFNTTDDAEDPDRLYELYAVVIHIGSNAYHGHYVSVIKTQDRGWLLFDDEMVEPVDKNYVRNFFGDKPGTACAYVLFYQETTFEAMRKEQEAEGLAEVELAAAEAEALLNKQANGSGNGPPVSSSYVPSKAQNPTTPIDETKEFVSLDHAVTAPVPSSPSAAAPSKAFPTLHPTTSASPIPDGPRPKTKEEKEREKREAKEAAKEAEREAREGEKARKTAEKATLAAEKERIKAEEKRRKETEVKNKEQQRLQAEQDRKALAASKISAAEEDEKRKRDAVVAAAAPVPPTTPLMPIRENGASSVLAHHQENGTTAPPVLEKSKLFGSLSRSKTGSKSMSRKSFGLLGGKSGANDSRTSLANDDTAVEGDAGPQTPERHVKSTKDRFSFGGIGRKKSTLMNSSS